MELQHTYKFLTPDSSKTVLPFLGRSKRYALFARPDFPTLRLGKKLFVREDQLIEWIERHCSSGNTLEG